MVALAPSTTSARYTRVAVLFHWTIAALIVGNIVGGVVMVDVLSVSTLKFQIYQFHKATGLLILGLSLGRLAWRLAHRPPALPTNLKRWERAAAKLTHIGFYVLMIGVPLLGWAMVSASPKALATEVFGLFTAPDLPVPRGEAAESALKTAHSVGSKLIVALLILHVGAALKHKFVLKDGVLARMSLRRAR